MKTNRLLRSIEGMGERLLAQMAGVKCPVQCLTGLIGIIENWDLWEELNFASKADPFTLCAYNETQQVIQESFSIYEPFIRALGFNIRIMHSGTTAVERSEPAFNDKRSTLQILMYDVLALGLNLQKACGKVCRDVT